MADIKFSDLPAINSATASMTADILPIVHTGGATAGEKDRKITVQDMARLGLAHGRAIVPALTVNSAAASAANSVALNAAVAENAAYMAGIAATAGVAQNLVHTILLPSGTAHLHAPMRPTAANRGLSIVGTGRTTLSNITPSGDDLRVIEILNSQIGYADTCTTTATGATTFTLTAFVPPSTINDYQVGNVVYLTDNVEVTNGRANQIRAVIQSVNTGTDTVTCTGTIGYGRNRAKWTKGKKITAYPSANVVVVSAADGTAFAVESRVRLCDGFASGTEEYGEFLTVQTINTVSATATITLKEPPQRTYTVGNMSLIPGPHPTGIRLADFDLGGTYSGAVGAIMCKHVDGLTIENVRSLKGVVGATEDQIALTGCQGVVLTNVTSLVGLNSCLGVLFDGCCSWNGCANEEWTQSVVYNRSVINGALTITDNANNITFRDCMMYLTTGTVAAGCDHIGIVGGKLSSTVTGVSSDALRVEGVTVSGSFVCGGTGAAIIGNSFAGAGLLLGAGSGGVYGGNTGVVDASSVYTGWGAAGGTGALNHFSVATLASVPWATLLRPVASSSSIVQLAMAPSNASPVSNNCLLFMFNSGIHTDGVPTDYEVCQIGWPGNNRMTWDIQSSGTGVARDFLFSVNGAGIVQISATGIVLARAVSTDSVTPAALAADANNYSPGAHRFQRWSTGTGGNYSVTGMATGVAGEEREIWNVGGSGSITLTNEDASSTAANRWTTDGSASVVIGQGGLAVTRYDSTTGRWRASKAGGATAFSGARVFRTTDQSISNLSNTAVLFDSENYDTDSYHNTSSNTSRLTAPATGTYQVGYCINGESAAGGLNDAVVTILLNGTTVVLTNAVLSDSLLQIFASCCSTTIQMSASDFVEVKVLPEGDGVVLTHSGSSHPVFWINKLG